MSAVDENANLPVESKLVKGEQNQDASQNLGKNKEKGSADDQKSIKERAEDYVNRNKNKKKKKKNKRQRNKKINGSNNNQIANKLSSDKVADLKDGMGNDANEGESRKSEEIASKSSECFILKWNNFCFMREFCSDNSFSIYLLYDSYTVLLSLLWS